MFFFVIPFSILLVTVGAVTDPLLLETVQYYEKTLAPAASSMSTLKSNSSGQPKAIIQLEFGGLMGSGVISLTGTAKPGVITGFPASVAQSIYDPLISNVISRQNYSSSYSNMSPTSTKNFSYSYPLSTGGFSSSPTATLSVFQGDGQRLVPHRLFGLMAAIGIQLAAYSM